MTRAVVILLLAAFVIGLGLNKLAHSQSPLDAPVCTIWVPIRGGYQCAAIQTPSARQKSKLDHYHWYELTDIQNARLRAALKDYHPSKPIWILMGTPDSLALAEDFDSAFRDAGLKSEMDTALDIVQGLHTTDPRLANLITGATNMKVIVNSGTEEPKDYIALNFGRKVVVGK